MFDHLLELDRQLLLWFNGSESQYVDGVAMMLTSPLTWLLFFLALFYMVIRNNDSFLQTGLVVGAVAVCLLFADGLADGIVKPLVARPRPSHEPLLRDMIDLVANHRNTPYGFFSAHAANTMSVAVFLSLLVRNRWFTAIMLSWSLINCWTRMYLGLHYPLDILCGILWGSLVGCGVYYAYLRLRSRYKPSVRYISDIFTPTGYRHRDIMIVVIAFLLCCTIALLPVKSF